MPSSTTVTAGPTGTVALTPDTPSPTATPQVTPAPTARTPTATPQVTPTPAARSPTAAPRVTPTAGATATPTRTVPAVATATATRSPTAVPTIASTATVTVTTQQVTIATYPFRAFQREVTDPAFNWTWPMLDRAAYLASQPQPTPQAYHKLVMENAYLRVSVLPELGAACTRSFTSLPGTTCCTRTACSNHRPGPAAAGWIGGWLAGGRRRRMGAPVDEHGYAWGTPWGYDSLAFSDQEATLTVFQQPKGRLQISTDISLDADEAALTLRTRLTNPTNEAVDFKYWLNAMLAPGGRNRPSPALHFILPTGEVTVHSTGDPDLPAAGQPMSWPVYGARPESSGQLAPVPRRFCPSSAAQRVHGRV
ncbi:MAG: DUF5107 domain-containing protein [Anaerolineae bacterium]|nr:MAG: DUF5107 domain-containing protein [Anaerolineae bacterium]